MKMEGYDQTYDLELVKLVSARFLQPLLGLSTWLALRSRYRFLSGPFQALRTRNIGIDFMQVRRSTVTDTKAAQNPSYMKQTSVIPQSVIHIITTYLLGIHEKY